MSGVLSKQFEGYAGKSSMVRKMFEAGIKLKQQYGADKVCDFSIGNPDLPPPAEVKTAMLEIAEHALEPFAFGYMPNAGFPWLREMMAAELTKEQGTTVTADDVMFSGGAAGAMNALFRCILDPGDEILVSKPYFVEYGFYVENFGGNLKTVATKPDFNLDLAALEQAIGAKTRAVMVNSPNNPTGQIYPKEDLEKLAAILRKKSAEFGRPIILISDEPYRFLAFDGAVVPSVLPLYEYSVVLGSFAKNLSLPGERIGYLVATHNMPEKEKFMSSVIMASRIIGHVNAPIVGQKLLKHVLGKQVDLAVYAERRNAMAKVLTDAGIEFTMPKGAFYFFPLAPGGDDAAFCDELTKNLVLGVQGSAFGMPGYFRLAFCHSVDVIRRSADGFKKARAAFK
ncbi:MAG: pyridoxal phosphate-dependent aminotransferase [Deltaproteobacteria bacterium]|jgi:aspartate aminotransferase|nr:pyridoxal phosphate-dependent aminotransferase [Deltaproteobacteria bacterium]